MNKICFFFLGLFSFIFKLHKVILPNTNADLNALGIADFKKTYLY